MHRVLATNIQDLRMILLIAFLLAICGCEEYPSEISVERDV